jgi:putative hemolysin
MPFTTEFIVILLMLAFNAVFAAYEMALASISKVRLGVLVNQKRKGASEAMYMKDRMEASLAVVQVGITLVGAVAAATGGVGINEVFAPYLAQQFDLSETFAQVLALIFFIIPLSCFTIIFGELIPKTYALNNKIWVCLTLSPGMKVLSQLIYPLIIVLETIVKGAIHIVYKRTPKMSRGEDQVGLHELITLISLARTSRLIGAREERIVVSAAQLSLRSIREIMLSIEDVSTIPATSTLSEALIRAHMDMHTRFPVCSTEEDRNIIEGYINFKDIIAALKLNPSDPSIKGIIRPIKTVGEDAPISQVLEKMIQEKHHIALVGTKENQILGMITLEDIIEELIGEIEDEYDRLPTHIHPYSGGWIVGGAVTMGMIAQTAGTGWFSAEEVNLRLADWFAQRFEGRQLKGGEILESNGMQFVVRKLRRRKISEAIVTIAHQQPASDPQI